MQVGATHHMAATASCGVAETTAPQNSIPSSGAHVTVYNAYMASPDCALLHPVAWLIITLLVHVGAVYASAYIPLQAAGCLVNHTLSPAHCALQVAHLMAELSTQQSQHGANDSSSHEHAGTHREAAAASSSSSSGSASTITLLLALRLAWRGYDVVLRTSCPVADSSEQQRAAAAVKEGNMMGLKHTFIRITQPGLEETNPAVVVDPCFREQFEMAHITDRWAHCVLVGALRAAGHSACPAVAVLLWCAASSWAPKSTYARLGGFPLCSL